MNPIRYKSALTSKSDRCLLRTSGICPGADRISCICRLAPAQNSGQAVVTLSGCLPLAITLMARASRRKPRARSCHPARASRQSVSSGRLRFPCGRCVGIHRVVARCRLVSVRRSAELGRCLSIPARGRCCRQLSFRIHRFSRVLLPSPRWRCPTYLLNIAKRSLPEMILSGVGLASNDAVG